MKYADVTGNVYSSVTIDPTVGKDTVFTFTWSYSTQPLDISLYDPDKTRYCREKVLHNDCQPVNVTTDETYKTIRFTFNGIAKVSKVLYTFDNDVF